MAEQALTSFSHHASDKPVVLIADDSRVVRVSLKNILKDDCQIIEAEDGMQAWDILCKTPSVALVFSDLSMPKLDGRDLLTKIRSSDSTQIAKIPFIVVTGNEGGPENHQELAQLGADEVICKPFDPTNIKNHLATLVRRQESPTSKNEIDNALLETAVEAQSDFLEGIADREQFMGSASRELAFAIRNKNELAIALITIDQIDEIIAQYSDPAIEHILRALAEIVNEHIHPDDMLAYFGKGLFAILRPASNAIGTRYLGRRILEDLASKHFYLGESKQIVSASIAISAPDIKPGTRLTELIALAESRLKAAMENGGNKVVDKGNEILTSINLSTDTSELANHSIHSGGSSNYSHPPLSRSTTEINRLAAEQVAEIKAKYCIDSGDQDDQENVLIEHKQTIERLTNENRQLINEIAHWKKQSAESENLRRQLFEVESQQQQLQVKFNELQSENINLLQRAEKAENENSTLLHRAGTAERENNNLRQRIEAEENENQALIIEQASHSDSIDETQHFIEEENSHLQTQIVELSNRAEKAELESLRSNQLASSLRDNIKLLHMQLDQMQQQLTEEQQKKRPTVTKEKKSDIDNSVLESTSLLQADSEIGNDTENLNLSINTFPDNKPSSVTKETPSIHLFPDLDQVKSKQKTKAKPIIPPFHVESEPLIFKNGFNPSSFTIASIIFVVTLIIGGVYLYTVFSVESPKYDTTMEKSTEQTQAQSQIKASSSTTTPLVKKQTPKSTENRMTDVRDKGGDVMIAEELKLE